MRNLPNCKLFPGLRIAALTLASAAFLFLCQWLPGAHASGPFCGDDVVNQPTEQCDGADSSACPNRCAPPGHPKECTCIPLDSFTCYNTTGHRQFTVTLQDQLDLGSYHSFHKTLKIFCAPAAGSLAAIADPDTHLTVYRVKGPHSPKSGIKVSNRFGDFTFDTKRTETLMVPTSKSLKPAPPPAPPDPSAHLVDHYRCLRVRTVEATGFTKDTPVVVSDQFGTHEIILKRPKSLCVPTDKNGEGVKDPATLLICFRATALFDTAVSGVQIADQFGAESLRLRRVVEFCEPSVMGPGGPL